MATSYGKVTVNGAGLLDVGRFGHNGQQVIDQAL